MIENPCNNEVNEIDYGFHSVIPSRIAGKTIAPAWEARWRFSSWKVDIGSHGAPISVCDVPSNAHRRTLDQIVACGMNNSRQRCSRTRTKSPYHRSRMIRLQWVSYSLRNHEPPTDWLRLLFAHRLRFPIVPPTPSIGIRGSAGVPRAWMLVAKGLYQAPGAIR